MSWDQGTGTWTTLISGNIVSHTEPVTSPGMPYKVRVQAKNEHGSGLESDIFTIYAATSPNQPTAPTTSINNSYVKITWDSVDSNYAVIDGYIIKIVDSNGNYLQENLYCDAFNSVVV